VAATELVMLAGVEQDFGPNKLPGDKIHSTLVLANDLAYCYKCETVTIQGNVVRATHGETRTEVLGSGDGSKALQQFTLKQSPLTHVAATTPTGTESTLKVHVNDIRWHEAKSLAELKPTDRRFITRTDDQDNTTVIFGDGEHGTRLPTGVENVKAVYRTGIGKAGNVAAKQISQLATRPLGLKEVINPLPATGGADREGRDQARRNAPLAVMALDRLVSVQDYEDFARTFAGIAKASSVRLSDGHRQLVHLTVAGADDIPIAENSDLYRKLLQALRQFGDPQQPLRVEVRELMLLIISARVRILPDHQWESVEPKIREALLDTFSFELRKLGQDALLSEVISTIQRVSGVAYVDVDTFGGVPEKVPGSKPEERRFLTPITPTEIAEQIQDLGLNSRVLVELAGLQEGVIRPAQLAFLTPKVPDTLILTEITT
jgi:predicted phage baseplate assembly protein